MLHTILLLSTLTALPGSGSDITVALTESTRFESTRTVTQQGTGSMTETISSADSRWKMELTIPFSSADWARLAQDGSVSVKVGSAVIERKVSAQDGFDPQKNVFNFKLSRDVQPAATFKYLVLPTDPPPTPAPAKGTKLVFGTGSLSFKDSKLRITISSTGNAAPSIAGENFQGLGDGDFEGKLPIEVKIGDECQKAEMVITGSVKHKSSQKENFDNTKTQRIVQLALSGKA